MRSRSFCIPFVLGKAFLFKLLCSSCQVGTFTDSETRANHLRYQAGQILPIYGHNEHTFILSGSYDCFNDVVNNVTCLLERKVCLCCHLPMVVGIRDNSTFYNWRSSTTVQKWHRNFFVCLFVFYHRVWEYLTGLTIFYHFHPLYELKICSILNSLSKLGKSVFRGQLGHNTLPRVQIR